MTPLLKRLIDQLEQRGLRIAPGTEPGQLLLHGPDREKTPDVMHALKQFKGELLKIYQPHPREADDAPPAPADPEGEIRRAPSVRGA